MAKMYTEHGHQVRNKGNLSYLSSSKKNTVYLGKKVRSWRWSDLGNKDIFSIYHVPLQWKSSARKVFKDNMKYLWESNPQWQSSQGIALILTCFRHLVPSIINLLWLFFMDRNGNDIVVLST
jgi:hypothetical protein